VVIAFLALTPLDAKIASCTLTARSLRSTTVELEQAATRYEFPQRLVSK